METDNATYTVGNMLREAYHALAACDSARLDAELLLAHLLGIQRTTLYTQPERAVEPALFDDYRTLLRRRSHGEPLAYLTGRREFWSLSITVTPDSLVPRPETELLVERVPALLQGRAEVHIADLGTGSGAIAIALATELPHARIVATDNSTTALAVARDNGDRLCPGRIEFRHGDWCAALDGECFDLIVCNPPYVADSDPVLSMGELQYEPRNALAAGPDGLDALRVIIPAARRNLAPGGALALEHGADQAPAVTRLLNANGYDRIETLTDLAGLPRATAAGWPA